MYILNIFQHIDICLYYLWKIAKYHPDILVKLTITDTQFDQNVAGLYKRSLVESGLDLVVKQSDLVAEYPFGFYMRYNTN